jgi:hypothetical protein
MAEFKPEIGLVVRHAYLWWDEKPASVTVDLVAKIRKNARDRSISVVEHDDAALNQEVRKRHKKTTKPRERSTRARRREE